MVSMGKIVHLGAAALCGAAVLIGTMTAPVTAEPETPVIYPSRSSSNRANGLGFDTCAAPSLAQLKAWKGTSPYTIVNIYFGGINRGCTQPNLTKAWVRDATVMGWKLLTRSRQPRLASGRAGINQLWLARDPKVFARVPRVSGKRSKERSASSPPWGWSPRSPSASASPQ